MTLRQTVTRLALAAAASLGVSLGAVGAAQAYEAAAATDLNMRSGPGTQYRVLDTIPGGERVSVGDCSGSWCRVDFDGLRGWASANYLRDTSYAPRRHYREPAYREPVYREPVYEEPIIIEAPIVRGPRIVRRAPVYQPYPYRDYRPYRRAYRDDRRYRDYGNTGSVSFGISIGR